MKKYISCESTHIEYYCLIYVKNGKRNEATCHDSIRVLVCKCTRLHKSFKLPRKWQ